jgi:hypothetical protein
MKRILVVALLAVASVASAQQHSLAVKLASVDKGMVLTEDSLEAKRARAALREAAPLCVESQQRLADMASVIRNEAATKNIAVGAVEVLEMLVATQYDTGGKGRVECAQTMATYLTVRVTAGQNHALAAAAMRRMTIAANQLARK